MRNRLDLAKACVSFVSAMGYAALYQVWIKQVAGAMGAVGGLAGGATQDVINAMLASHICKAN